MMEFDVKAGVLPLHHAEKLNTERIFYIYIYLGTHFSRFAARWPTLAGLVPICSGCTLADLGSKYPTLATRTPGWSKHTLVSVAEGLGLGHVEVTGNGELIGKGH